MYCAIDDDIMMYYDDTGSGEPVIFIHGSLSMGNHAFAAQIPVFRHKYRALYPDMRGHGRTITTTYHWETPQLAEDVIRLLDNLHIRKAHIIGHSMGGDIAMYCATRYPSRICTITSICSTGFVNDEVIRYMQLFHPEFIDRKKYESFINKIKDKHALAHKGDWEIFLKTTVQNCKRYPNFTIKDLQKITMPFLLIYGECDSIVKTNEIVVLQNNVPCFKKQVIKKAGHFPHMPGQQCDEVNRVILEFLNANAISQSV